MNPEMMLDNNIVDLDIEEEWADFTADLLSLRSNESLLKNLFFHPIGQWLNFSDLLGKQDDIRQQLNKLQTDCAGILQVTWLGHPQLDRGYCLVLFYVDSLDWNNLSLYNKSRLEVVGQVAA
jgi:hypothetical protein